MDMDQGVLGDFILELLEVRLDIGAFKGMVDPVGHAAGRHFADCMLVPADHGPLPRGHRRDFWGTGVAPA